jgi:hypothetical protein
MPPTFPMAFPQTRYTVRRQVDISRPRAHCRVHFCGFPAADLQLGLASMSRPLQFRHFPSAYVLDPVTPSSVPSSTNVPPKDGDCAESRSCWSLQSSRNCALLCVQMHDDIQRRASHL